MISQTAATCVAIVAIAAILTSAGISDVRTRRVGDLHWVALLAVGIPLAALSVGTGCGGKAAMAYAMAAFLMGAYMLSPGVYGILVAPFIVFPGLLLAMAMRDGAGMECFAVFLQFAAFLVLHLFGLLTGGADAKCLMSLSLVLPAWAGPGTPFIVFSVALAALILAAAWVPAVSKRRGGGGCSYPRALADIDTTTEWPTGWEFGGVRSTCRPSYRRADEIIECLKDLGVQEARVTPVIPFVAFVAAAFAMLAAGQFLI